jgi:sterol desaturase/sphingolipid hydroxylase (fatty acid hydroxylase superfamily)
MSRVDAMRTDDLRTKRDLGRTFLRQGSPRVIVVAVVAASAARLLVGRWSWVDAVVVCATLLAVGVVEWVLHRNLLHASESAWTSRRLGTGSGHRRHHLDPPDLEWLLLRRSDAMVFAALIAIGSCLWVLPAMAVVGPWIGVGLLAPTLTAIVAAYAALAHYEWLHLLEHSRYRPRTRYYRRLVRNHRRHHYRNERYWLGITSSLGDRMLGTYPAIKTDVAPSETARTLADAIPVKPGTTDTGTINPGTIDAGAIDSR